MARALSGSIQALIDVPAGKIAVVAGGANGIGAAAVRPLAGKDASVWVFDREPPELRTSGRRFARTSGRY
jgi:NAD(P)-dependent dehydrogenase (short-subunit alcohol dehydrogenase family)